MNFWKTHESFESLLMADQKFPLFPIDEEERKDILVACQCGLVSHWDDEPILTDRNVSILEDDRFRTVLFLDPVCDITSSAQFTSWSELPDKSLDIIWLMNCPAYPGMLWEFYAKNPDIYFEKAVQRTLDNKESGRIWREIVTHGWRATRDNGQIIIPYTTNIGAEAALLTRIFREVLKRLSSESPNQWKAMVRRPEFRLLYEKEKKGDPKFEYAVYLEKQ